MTSENLEEFPQLLGTGCRNSGREAEFDIVLADGDDDAMHTVGDALRAVENALSAKKH